MKPKKPTFILKILFFCMLFLSIVMGICEGMAGDIANGVVRLHVVAHSDSGNDQQIKLAVRDAVLREGGKVKNEKELLSAIGQTADAVLSEYGAEYGCSVERGRFYFPTRHYKNLTLPAGEYDAVRIILGKGEGENWWCVMTPPLCFTASVAGVLSEESEVQLSEKMEAASFAVITSEKVTVRPALKVLEIWGALEYKMKRFFEK